MTLTFVIVWGEIHCGLLPEFSEIAVNAVLYTTLSSINSSRSTCKPEVVKITSPNYQLSLPDFNVTKLLTSISGTLKNKGAISSALRTTGQNKSICIFVDIIDCRRKFVMCSELQYLFEFHGSSKCNLFTYCQVITVIIRDLYYCVLRAKSSQSAITLI